MRKIQASEFTLKSMMMCSLLIATCLLIPRTGNAMNIELTITADTNVFVSGETVWIDLMLINMADTAVYIPWPSSLNNSIGFDAQTSEGDTLCPGLIMFCGLGEPRTWLEPGDTFYNTIELELEHIPPWPNKGIDWRTYEDPPVVGDISITCVYLDHYRSNTLNVHFRDADSTRGCMYELWLNRGRPCANNYNGERAMKRLIYEFPDSLLADAACGWLIRHFGCELSRGGDADSARKYSYYLITNYPASGHVYRALPNVCKIRDLKSGELDELFPNGVPLEVRMIARSAQRGFSTGL